MQRGNGSVTVGNRFAFLFLIYDRKKLCNCSLIDEDKYAKIFLVHSS